MRPAFDARGAISITRLKCDAAELLRNFETSAQCKKRNRRLAGILDRQPSLPAHYLANELRSCGERVGGMRAYCGLSSCAVCMRPARRWLTNEIAILAQRYKTKTGNYGVAVTVIASGLVAPLGGLCTVDIASIRRRFSRAITRLRPGLPVVGGIDVSFNEKADSSEAGHYQVHLYFVVLGYPASKKARARLTRKLHGCFRLEPTAAVRVAVRRFRNPARQGSYVLKSLFTKRLSIIDGTGRRNTKKYPLKAKQLAEIALWLRRWRPLSRVLLHGVQLRRNHLVIQPKIYSKKKETQP